MRTDGVSAVATQPLPGKACHCRCSRMLVMMYRVVIKRVLTAAAGSNIGCDDAWDAQGAAGGMTRMPHVGG